MYNASNWSLVCSERDIIARSIPNVDPILGGKKIAQHLAIMVPGSIYCHIDIRNTYLPHFQVGNTTLYCRGSNLRKHYSYPSTTCKWNMLIRFVYAYIIL